MFIHFATKSIPISSVCGHEFIGEVIALGENFHPGVTGRPPLYATLKVGDKVVSPFTVSCGECQYVLVYLQDYIVTVFTSYCRIGFSCRCVESRLFGTPNTPGGQAQYVRVPRAGGTLYNLVGISAASVRPDEETKETIGRLADSSLLLLCDILPTGVFAAFQALNHPKTLPILTSLAYPQSSGSALLESGVSVPLKAEDKALMIAIVGLGPVGVVRRCR